MRNLKIIICALAATAAAPSSANAQSLDQVIGVIGGAASLGYNPCSYVSGDTAKVLCQVNRAARLAKDGQNVLGHRGTQKYWDGNDKANQLNALQRACRAGDRLSCERSGGPSPESMEIARALLDACRAGDKFSCRRIDAIMGR